VGAPVCRKEDENCRQFLIIQNRINKFVDLRTYCLTHCLDQFFFRNYLHIEHLIIRHVSYGEMKVVLDISKCIERQFLLQIWPYHFLKFV
jgi:hypothetical protein